MSNTGIFISLRTAYEKGFSGQLDMDDAPCWSNADWLTNGPEQGRDRWQSSLGMEREYSMKSTDCGYSGYFSLFLTLGFTSSFSMS